MDRKEEPRYKDEFEEYAMAVAMIKILCKKGMIPETVYEKIKRLIMNEPITLEKQAS